MSNRVKTALREFANMPGVRKVRAQSRGVEETIDLIAQRLRTEITVRMEDRYPNRIEIFRALTAAIDEQSDELESFFGDPENRLD